MKERPILFSGEMVRALLAGTKTQTRRIIKPQPDVTEERLREMDAWIDGFTLSQQVDAAWQHGFIDAKCPYGQPGDRVWVRETWAAHRDEDNLPPRECSRDVRFYAVEHGKQHGLNPRIGKWRPSIHMPRWHSRILLEITDVRVERLQDISEADAEAEGCERLDSERDERDWKLCPQCGGTGLHNALGSNGGVIFDVDCSTCDTYVKRYRYLWEAINGAGSWDANPWVWVIEFKRIEAQP